MSSPISQRRLRRIFQYSSSSINGLVSALWKSRATRRYRTSRQSASLDPHGVPVVKLTLADVAGVAAIGIHDPQLLTLGIPVRPKDYLLAIRRVGRMLIPLPGI